MRRPLPRPDRRRCRPPGKESGTHVEALTTCTLSVAADIADGQDAEDDEVYLAGYAEWHARFIAQSLVKEEALAQAALRSLSTQQLRDIRWIGLVDQGWRRMYAELDRRGEE